jgi:hypothetical protein
LDGDITIAGQDLDIMQQSPSGFGVIPIGPTWHA